MNMDELGTQHEEIALIAAQLRQAIADPDLPQAVSALRWQLARKLMDKNPTVLKQAKIAHRIASEMSWEQGADYLMAKSDQSLLHDAERGRDTGMSQFLDDKSFRPGLGAYRRDSR